MGHIQTTPAGTYRAVWHDAANRKRTKNFTRKTDAKNHLREIDADLVKGEYIDPDRGKLTLREWTELYLASAIKRTSTAGMDADALRHILPVLGDHRLSVLEQEHLLVQGYLKKKLDEGRLAPSTIDRHYRVLNMLFNAAVADDRMRKNPCKKVTRPDVPDTEMNFLTPEEIHALAAEFPERYRVWPYFAAYLGPRWSEGIAVRVGTDLNLMTRKLAITDQLYRVPTTKEWVRSPLKTKASKRSLAVPPTLINMLSEHIAEFGSTERGSLVFTTRNGTPPLASSFRNNVLQPALKRAGMSPAVRIHDFRHTSVALAIARGAHPKAIQRRLGHSSIKMTLDQYGHLFPELDESLAEDLDVTLIGSMLGSSVTELRPAGAVARTLLLTGS